MSEEMKGVGSFEKDLVHDIATTPSCSLTASFLSLPHPAPSLPYVIQYQDFSTSASSSNTCWIAIDGVLGAL